MVRSGTFASAGTLVFSVPVFLLALDGTIAGVPAAQVDGLLLTVVTLQEYTTYSTTPHTYFIVLPQYQHTTILAVLLRIKYL